TNYSGTITITSNTSGASISYPSTGSYTISNLSAGSYTISYANKPADYALTYPVNGSSPPSFFNVRVGGGCNGSSFNANCDGSNNISNLNFGLTQAIAHKKVFCGDVREDNGISGAISASDTCGGTTTPVISECGDNPGIVFSGDSTFDPSKASSKQWVVSGQNASFTPEHPGVIRTSYDYEFSVAKQGGLKPVDIYGMSSCPGSSNCSLPQDASGNVNLDHGIYATDPAGTDTQMQKDLHIKAGATTFPAGKNYVILVSGNLYIEGKVFVPIGSTVTFSVKGNIIVAPNIGESPTTACNVTTHAGCDIEGFYSSDKSFIVQGYSCSDTSSPKLRLNVAGSIVVNAGHTGGTLNNQRDLCGGNTCPAITISQRPDFLFNVPDFLKYPNTIWQEVAP
ncbi:MAG TPA: hypothetical protein VLF68_04590, partial [Candidatus Saccharimonadales bacterium]|nr:hypothetical protein [Candidatus Saccharimonadales bacterium]